MIWWIYFFLRPQSYIQAMELLWNSINSKRKAKHITLIHLVVHYIVIKQFSKWQMIEKNCPPTRKNTQTKIISIYFSNNSKLNSLSGKLVTYVVQFQFRFHFVGLVVAGQLIENGSGSSSAIVGGRCLRVQVAVGVCKEARVSTTEPSPKNGRWTHNTSK